jgi:DedD protein
MAFFKFRSAGQKGADEPVAKRGRAESVEVIRRRARHRLIGAAVLVLVGIVGFPLLFDTQPRPIPVDIPIEIPDKAKAKSLAVPGDTVTLKRATPEVAPQAPTPTPAPVPAAKPVANAAPAPGVAASASLGAKEEVVASRTEPKPEAKPAAPIKPEIKPETKAEPAKPADDGAKAKALLEGKPVTEAAADKERFIVQVGAFSEAARAREARLKVEKAGLKTYTQEVETADGKRIRVRVGPFASRAEADKAASKIKGLDLPASILTL